MATRKPLAARVSVALFAAALAGCGFDDGAEERQRARAVFTGDAAPLRVDRNPDGHPVLNCDFETTCPEIAVEGLPLDAPCLVAADAPLFAICPVRGHHDAALALDPRTGALWMSFTRSSLAFDGAPSRDAVVGIHHTALAVSDDDGRSWRYVGLINRGRAIDHPRLGRVKMAYEAPTLTRLPDGRWLLVSQKYAARFQDSVLAARMAAAPDALAAAPEHMDAAGYANPRVWPGRVDLSRLDPAVSDCAAFTEPALFTHDGQAYFAAECIAWNIAEHRRVHEGGGVHLFTVTIEGDRRRFTYVGPLVTFEDARAISGGSAETIASQPSLARARDGSVLLFISIGDETRDPHYAGCHVLEVADLATATLRRSETGRLWVRAEIRAPQNATGLLGPGQCAYHADSATGVVLAHMREDRALEPLDLRVALHATGLHP